MKYRTPHSAPSTLDRRVGFTLMELLIVITLMVFITTITVMNYFGMKRAGKFTTVSSNLLNTLHMVRQRACLDNNPALLYLLDKTNYVVQVTDGSSVAAITTPYTSGGRPAGSQFFWDRDREEANAPDTNTPMYNLDQPGSTALIYSTEAYQNGYTDLAVSNVTASGVISNYTVSAWRLLVVPTGPWAAGDHYAVQAFSPLSLPEGFVFVFDPDPPVAARQRMVRFNADGTADITGGLSSLVVKETITGKTISFSIGANGAIR